MSALQDLLYKYREIYEGVQSTGSIKGKWFEKICLYFLRHDLGYMEKFESVYLWSDWPLRDNKPDTGIDIVAKIRDSDKFCAVQCKFYEPTHSISKPDIDTFLSASSKEIFSQRIIISTSPNWNKNAQDTIQNQNPPCIRLGIDSLEQSSIDWSRFNIDDLESVAYLPSKTLRPDQYKAVNRVIECFSKHDRGKMIMACGTGKTFVSLKIAEIFAGAGKKVLFLVPSIALLNQTLLAWNTDRDKNLHMIFFAVCSDKTVGRTDDEDLKPTDLAYPATTHSDDLIRSWEFIPDQRKQSSMTVIFSTYQSLKVINEIQRAGFPDFDLIICDEAHRTTGSTLQNNDDSEFVRVHDNNFIHARKRLYMTATPKVYSEAASRKAKDKAVEIFSMDDKNLFGEDFYTMSFSEAIRENLLSDYRVMVLAIDERAVNETIRDLIDKQELDPDDATKMIGCWRGLSKQYHSSDSQFLKADPAPMKMALAFTSTIKNSQAFRKNFAEVIQRYKDTYDYKDGVNCEVRHVDGTMNMDERKREISWLKEGSGNNECRILSNARCLSEGIDVPALDAILFLNPKRSKVDIVQCVGRVMRKYNGKNLGYVILPIVIPENMSPEQALDNNKNYNVIWDVLQALRSIDDRFYIEVNSLQYDSKATKISTGIIGKGFGDEKEDAILSLPFTPEDWRDAVYAKIVEKCGNRQYESQWANDMAKIVENHTRKIHELLNVNDEFRNIVFARYMRGLHDSINKNISQAEAIDMLSQHFITKPIFDAIFENFSRYNPVSIIMDAALEYLGANDFNDNNDKLTRFYAEQRERFINLKTDQGRQKRIKDLYENFFRIALPRTAQRLGIVYTPNEVVDFILRSADWALRDEFNITEGLSSKNVNILDPFTGTGTFLVRLIQLGLISPDKLEYKYNNELYAQEILLLAYYISAVNIEMAHHAAAPDKEYQPFPGIILTDTFNTEHQIGIFTQNDERTVKLNEKNITVIVGNPPYSVGQKSANDNNQNTKYSSLDAEITRTYATHSTATNKNSLYDSYIRAIRWASDRIGNKGLICYVTNGSFLDSNSADGLRKCLYDEFQSIYIYNLRGNANTSGELRKQEAGNVFASGSRLPVAITLLIKNPARSGQTCEIFYHDIGDYLNREAKLGMITHEESFGKMSAQGKLTRIIPNEHGDWIRQRNEIFYTFMRLGNKKEAECFAIFGDRYSQGVKTARDSWVYNFSRYALSANMSSMIEVYNTERERWNNRVNDEREVQDFVTSDPQKISWADGLFARLERNQELRFSEELIAKSLYRPYTKMNLYYDVDLDERVYRMPNIFPTYKTENRVICVTGRSNNNFSVLMTDCIPDVSVVATDQCFPLYWYDTDPSKSQMTIFDNPSGPGKYTRHDGISDEALTKFRVHYDDDTITKEDVFYYIYGVLSSSEYSERFCDDVRKILARVPFAKVFWEFSEAGRKLGELHVNYESIAAFEGLVIESKGNESDEHYRVRKMRIMKSSGERYIQYNEFITIKGIPTEAWDYVVNGKSALEWIVERYQDSTDKASGLRNDCNAWGKEHGNSKYVLELIGRVVNVSVESVRILEGLPELGV